MNKRATEILESTKNSEDYEKVNLSNEQYNYIYTKCAEITTDNEEKLWDKVEELFHIFLIELGYKWTENTYQWELPITA
jgi:CRISPR/Cas system CSM-associated protein Csm2 small subunit